MSASTLQPRQTRSQQTRERILLTAEHMLNQNPYGELSMPGLAAAAQISVGGLYGRFASREDLLDAVHDRYRVRRDALFEQRLKPLVDGNADLPDRVEALARAFVDLHSGNAGVLRSFLISKWLSPATGPSPQIKQEVRDHTAYFVEFLMAAPSLTPPGSAHKPDHSQFRRAVAYLISISKDQLVITPDDAVERAAINLDLMVADLTHIALSLLRPDTYPET